MNDKIKNKIERILNYIESGSQSGDYGCISLYKDGPSGIRQVTYGKSQTTEWGNLKDLIKLYCEKNGLFAKDLRSYIDIIGKVSVVDDQKFLTLLGKAAKDQIMQDSQDEFFDKHYWQPALAWFEKNKFTLNLSMLVIYDSFIQSGSILKFLRNKFVEKVPLDGGDEKAWINSYVTERHKWLSTHSNPDLVASSYRTKDLLRAIKEENWDLSKVYECNGEKVS